MSSYSVTAHDVGKALGLGALVSLIVTALMIPLVLGGLLPVEQPFALTFARALFGEVPLPIGMLLHVLYVLFWSSVYVLWCTNRPFYNAALLAGSLWLIQVIVWYPVAGWGFLGLEVAVTTATVSLIPHILLFIILGITGSLMQSDTDVA